MRALLRVGFALLVLAVVLIGLTYTMLRAQGVPMRLEGRSVTSDTRSIERGVRAIELSAPVDLSVHYGPQPGLVVRGEARLLQNIDTSSRDGVLRIGTQGILLRHRQPLEVEVTLPMLERLALDGSGDLSVDAGNSDSIEAELMGSGALSLAGATRRFKYEGSGTGILDAQRLRVEQAQLRQSGSGRASITVRDTVNAAVSGSGDIEVHGEPSQRTVSRSGSGNVQFVE